MRPVLVMVVLLVRRAGAALPEDIRDLRDAEDIEDERDATVAEDGRARELLDSLELLPERLHDDLLRVVHRIDDQAERPLIGAQHHDVEHLVRVPIRRRNSSAAVQIKDLSEIDEREQSATQTIHRGPVDLLDRAARVRPLESHELCQVHPGNRESLRAPCTRSAGMIARVSGILILSVVPDPGRFTRSRVPPIFSILVRTTSIPTPRPETLVTFAAVENPGAKMRFVRSRVCSCARRRRERPHPSRWRAPSPARRRCRRRRRRSRY